MTNTTNLSSNLSSGLGSNLTSNVTIRTNLRREQKNRRNELEKEIKKRNIELFNETYDVRLLASRAKEIENALNNRLELPDGMTREQAIEQHTRAKKILDLVATKTRLKSELHSVELDSLLPKIEINDEKLTSEVKKQLGRETKEIQAIEDRVATQLSSVLSKDQLRALYLYDVFNSMMVGIHYGDGVNQTYLDSVSRDLSKQIKRKEVEILLPKKREELNKQLQIYREEFNKGTIDYKHYNEFRSTIDDKLEKFEIDYIRGAGTYDNIIANQKARRDAGYYDFKSNPNAIFNETNRLKAIEEAKELKKTDPIRFENKYTQKFKDSLKAKTTPLLQKIEGEPNGVASSVDGGVIMSDGSVRNLTHNQEIEIYKAAADYDISYLMNEFDMTRDDAIKAFSKGKLGAESATNRAKQEMNTLKTKGSAYFPYIGDVTLEQNMSIAPSEDVIKQEVKPPKTRSVTTDTGKLYSEAPLTSIEPVKGEKVEPLVTLSTEDVTSTTENQGSLVNESKQLITVDKEEEEKKSPWADMEIVIPENIVKEMRLSDQLNVASMYGDAGLALVQKNWSYYKQFAPGYEASLEKVKEDLKNTGKAYVPGYGDLVLDPPKAEEDYKPTDPIDVVYEDGTKKTMTYRAYKILTEKRNEFLKEQEEHTYTKTPQTVVNETIAEGKIGLKSTTGEGALPAWYIDPSLNLDSGEKNNDSVEEYEPATFAKVFKIDNKDVGAIYSESAPWGEAGYTETEEQIEEEPEVPKIIGQAEIDKNAEKIQKFGEDVKETILNLGYSPAREIVEIDPSLNEETRKYFEEQLNRGDFKPIKSIYELTTQGAEALHQIAAGQRERGSWVLGVPGLLLDATGAVVSIPPMLLDTPQFTGGIIGEAYKLNEYEKMRYGYEDPEVRKQYAELSDQEYKNIYSNYLRSMRASPILSSNDPRIAKLGNSGHPGVDIVGNIGKSALTEVAVPSADILLELGIQTALLGGRFGKSKAKSVPKGTGLKNVPTHVSAEVIKNLDTTRNIRFPSSFAESAYKGAMRKVPKIEYFKAGDIRDKEIVARYSGDVIQSSAKRGPLTPYEIAEIRKRYTKLDSASEWPGFIENLKDIESIWESNLAGDLKLEFLRKKTGEIVSTYNLDLKLNGNTGKIRKSRQSQIIDSIGADQASEHFGSIASYENIKPSNIYDWQSANKLYELTKKDLDYSGIQKQKLTGMDAQYIAKPIKTILSKDRLIKNGVEIQKQLNNLDLETLGEKTIGEARQSRISPQLIDTTYIDGIKVNYNKFADINVIERLIKEMRKNGDLGQIKEFNYGITNPVGSKTGWYSKIKNSIDIPLNGLDRIREIVHEGTHSTQPRFVKGDMRLRPLVRGASNALETVVQTPKTLAEVAKYGGKGSFDLAKKYLSKYKKSNWPAELEAYAKAERRIPYYEDFLNSYKLKLDGKQYPYLNEMGHNVADFGKYYTYLDDTNLDNSRVRLYWPESKVFNADRTSPIIRGDYRMPDIRRKDMRSIDKTTPTYEVVDVIDPKDTKLLSAYIQDATKQTPISLSKSDSKTFATKVLPQRISPTEKNAFSREFAKYLDEIKAYKDRDYFFSETTNRAGQKQVREIDVISQHPDRVPTEYLNRINERKDFGIKPKVNIPRTNTYEFVSGKWRTPKNNNIIDNTKMYSSTEDLRRLIPEDKYRLQKQKLLDEIFERPLEGAEKPLLLPEVAGRTENIPLLERGPKTSMNIYPKAKKVLGNSKVSDWEFIGVNGPFRDYRMSNLKRIQDAIKRREKYLEERKKGDFGATNSLDWIKRNRKKIERVADDTDSYTPDYTRPGETMTSDKQIQRADQVSVTHSSIPRSVLNLEDITRRFKPSEEFVTVTKRGGDKLKITPETMRGLTFLITHKDDSNLMFRNLQKENQENNIRQSFRQVPKETPKQVPKQIGKQIPKQIGKQIPKQTGKQIPKQIVKQVQKQIVKQIPKLVPKEVPKLVPKEIPKIKIYETPKIVIEDIRFPKLVNLPEGNDDGRGEGWVNIIYTKRGPIIGKEVFANKKASESFGKTLMEETAFDAFKSVKASSLGINIDKNKQFDSGLDGYKDSNFFATEDGGWIEKKALNKLKRRTQEKGVKSNKLSKVKNRNTGKRKGSGNIMKALSNMQRV